MQFQAEQEIGLPIHLAFEQLTNFARFEREARDSGAEIARRDPAGGPGLGTTWEADFIARGKARHLTATATRFARPGDLAFEGRIGGMEGVLHLTLTSLGEQRSLIAATMTLHPRSITARLALQSLKLVRGSIAKRFRKRLRKFCRQTERRLALA